MTNKEIDLSVEQHFAHARFKVQIESLSLEECKLLLVDLHKAFLAQQAVAVNLFGEKMRIDKDGIH